MPSIQFDINPYTFNAAALTIIGMVCVVYLLRIKEKTRAIRLVTAGLTCFTLSVLTILANCIVFWGSALIPLTDAFAVLSMVFIAEFCFEYSPKIQTLSIRYFRHTLYIISFWAFIVSINYAVQFVITHNFQNNIPPFFWYLNPFSLLTTFIICIWRAFLFQKSSVGAKISKKALFLSLWKKPDGKARLFRNYAAAFCIGSIQGLASILGKQGTIPVSISAYLINLSLLIMAVIIVYTSFELLDHQPGLVIQFIGLTLVVLLSIMGINGMYNSHNATQLIIDRNQETLEQVRNAVKSDQLGFLPNEVAYIVRFSNPDSQAKIIYSAHEEQFSDNLLNETIAYEPPVWEYFIELELHENNTDTPLVFHYGNHPVGSYHQFAAYSFSVNKARYEIGFDLDDLSLPVRKQNLNLVYTVLFSSFFILAIFPLFFRSNLIKPLNNLLSGIHKANDGDLTIRVKVTQNDEIGYITKNFNKFIATLQDELNQRRAAEIKLQELNQTLEKRVANRTRELETLYDVSAAASQTHQLQDLLSLSLTRIMSALPNTQGMIYLRNTTDRAEATELFNLGTIENALPNLVLQSNQLLSQQEFIRIVLDKQDPILIDNIAKDPLSKDIFPENDSTSLIIVPLYAEGQVLGILNLYRNRGLGFSLDEIALLNSIGGQIGLAIHTEKMRQSVQRTAVLEERQRLTRDLHDSVIQSLYGLVTLTEAGKIRIEAEDLEGSSHLLSRIGQTARHAIREIRLFIHQLRPPVLEQEGLISALEQRLTAVEGRSDVQINFQADETIVLPLKVQTELYYIAQEALNNTLKHAKANTVDIHFYQTDSHITLDIQDNGQGYAPEHCKNDGLGVNNMCERADTINAILDINTSPGHGTNICVTIKKGASI
jgi:signal transduction histidine kinase